ncbi:glutamyl-tRNA amidotransferase beta subunit [Schizosaccharomyces japonicus yFS275]|uniref:Glutamyl-tRNA(Gln) amidotransferase subunit B, mitochondrial n=1 Tax=Schizosaccharomyces japonicus (strain yFS275 / FY16936) TaxID=402676 RepID=GATB_SCHJY|nr:glutamyl-tRNA amidotransferase beta subunit [Schizosaccharomyces japonicus yFS275]B6JYB6.1 RecName: Full=Glutamyl-tRNA(Gln) amidotransferase subunit B, mitochondrial; Short=Glu-AdT subunit B [Schizosaccharomyces japonicus yFS275]EEB06534.1 glutamyl-tRNA amidotransferase beta subunit [Schizosaccharomyces japonicus yFS275]
MSSLARWIITIGLEVHVQLSTKLKLFSRALAENHKAPNSAVSFFDISLPGTLPIVNPEAIRLATKAALVCNCEIAPSLEFDRKHYVYSDQRAGFQITQKRRPLGTNGFVRLNAALDGVEKDQLVEIKCLQLEQDTGKTVNELNEDLVLLDFNRANVPLIEVVTAPCFHSPHDAACFLRKLQTILRLANVSDAKMELGNMRCDVNVSVASAENPTKQLATVELKNLPSIRYVEIASELEAKRQIELLNNGSSPVPETRSYDVEKNATVFLRKKRGPSDYMYLPEADIPEITLTSAYVDDVRKSIGPSVDELLETLLQKKYFNLQDAKALLQTEDGLSYYQVLVGELEKVTSSMSPDVQLKAEKLIPFWLVNEYVGDCANAPDEKRDLDTIPPADLAFLLGNLANGTLSAYAAKHILQLAVQDPKKNSIYKLVNENANAEFDENTLKDLVNELIQANGDKVNALKVGKDGVLNWFIGNVMRRSSGKAKPDEIKRLINNTVLCENSSK